MGIARRRTFLASRKLGGVGLAQYQRPRCSERLDDTGIDIDVVPLVDGRKVGCWHIFGVDNVLHGYAYAMKWAALLGRDRIEGASGSEDELGVEVCPAADERVAFIDMTNDGLCAACQL